MKWCQLLLVMLCAAVAITSGQQIYLTLGTGSNITDPNTEILITDIGEDAPGGLPSLTCHTDLTTCCRNGDNNNMGRLGQWTYPDGSVVRTNAGAVDTGDGFYFVRNDAQLIRLARRETNNPLSPTGLYCCTVPTTGGNMTLCANLVLCPSLSLDNGTITYNDNTLGLNTEATHTCNPGYTLGGGNTRTCGSNGQWSRSPPVCINLQLACEDLPVPANGVITYTTAALPRPKGTIAVQHCREGYIPATNSSSTRECESTSNRQWSGAALVCNLPLVYVSLGTTNYAVMNSQIDIDTIGDTAESALTCRTDLSTCCRRQDNPDDSNGFGQWQFPNKTNIISNFQVTDSDTDLFYRSRGTSTLLLHRRGSVSGPTGSYCCVLPASTGEVTFCVELVDSVSFFTQATTDKAPAFEYSYIGVILGSVAGLLSVIIIVTGVILVTYLVLRHKRGANKPISCEYTTSNDGQSSEPVYECCYEELTQNEAYQIASVRGITTLPPGYN